MNGLTAVEVTVLGSVIVLLTLLDVLITALHPTSESPFSARFHRGVWASVRHLSRLIPASRRSAALGWTLPASIAGLVVSWMLSLLVGFALVYMPSIVMSSAAAGSSAQFHGAFYSLSGHLGWGDAFYLSGLCLSTIGFGDIVPLHAALRAICVFEGLTGLLVVGVTITYVLAVFPVLPMAGSG